MEAQSASGGAAASGRRTSLSTDDHEQLLDRLRHALQYAEAARTTVEDALRLLEAAREDEEG